MDQEDDRIIGRISDILISQENDLAYLDFFRRVLADQRPLSYSGIPGRFTVHSKAGFRMPALTETPVAYLVKAGATAKAGPGDRKKAVDGYR